MLLMAAIELDSSLVATPTTGCSRWIMGVAITSQSGAAGFVRV